MEQVRVTETEIHGLFDFRKDAMTKLQARGQNCEMMKGECFVIPKCPAPSLCVGFCVSIALAWQRNTMLHVLAWICDSKVWSLVKIMTIDRKHRRSIDIWRL